MSPGPSAAGSRPGRGPRTAVAAVALLVLVLAAVLVGLLTGGASDGSATPAGPGAATSGASTATGRAPSPNRSSSAPSDAPSAGSRDPDSGLRVVALTSLPREAQTTVRLIDAGGPFPYAKDGATFSNREGVLPSHARGWYREYTVPTPGEGDRGARRIVTGDDDRLVFYTADHYDSFVRVAR